jgi:hypothetical protein
MHCIDALLGIEFEMPAALGEITGVLRNGAELGLTYSYGFENQLKPPNIILEAGGNSRDFSEGRESRFIDFNGFLGKLDVELCKYPNFPICEKIQPAVLFQIMSPQADRICDPAPGTIFTFLSFVKIDLPDNPTINGFVFVSEFLSDAYRSELNTILGLTESGPSDCQSPSMLAYDEKVAEIIDKINSGTIDAETLHNLDQLRHLAESIQSW